LLQAPSDNVVAIRRLLVKKNNRMLLFFIIQRGFSINAAADWLIQAYLPPAM
jgi:hypothetical protein